MNDLFGSLAKLNPNPKPITDLEWDHDGDDINVSVCVRGEWEDIKIKRDQFERWLNDKEYLRGSEDIYRPENDFEGDTVVWSFTYEAYLSELLTEEIIREYLITKGYE